MKRGFTLIEMTIVVAIIAILAAMALSVYNTALSQSKEMRTRAIIAKIDQLIGEKYDGYRTRQVPIRILPGTTTNLAAKIRVDAIRELQRLELPDRITDVTAGPAYVDSTGNQIPQAGFLVYPLARLTARPSINKQYLRRAFKAHAPGNTAITGLQYWTTANENAECLYLILACMRDGDKSALDWFSPTEIGDVDNDGMNEILDGFGQPIAFLRWAPGYTWENGATTTQVSNPDDAGFVSDPFDPLKVYGTSNYSLKPLIVSGGADKLIRVTPNTPNDASGVPMPYAASNPPNNPYWNQPVLVGTPTAPEAADNITNHDLEAR